MCEQNHNRTEHKCFLLFISFQGFEDCLILDQLLEKHDNNFGNVIFFVSPFEFLCKLLSFQPCHFPRVGGHLIEMREGTVVTLGVLFRAVLT